MASIGAEQLKSMLTEVVVSLCKSGVQYSDQLKIEALLAVTVDTTDVIVVNINEKFSISPDDSSCSENNLKENRSKKTIKKKRSYNGCRNDNKVKKLKKSDCSPSLQAKVVISDGSECRQTGDEPEAISEPGEPGLLMSCSEEKQTDQADMVTVLVEPAVLAIPNTSVTVTSSPGDKPPQTTTSGEEASSPTAQELTYDNITGPESKDLAYTTITVVEDPLAECGEHLQFPNEKIICQVCSTELDTVADLKKHMLQHWTRHNYKVVSRNSNKSSKDKTDLLCKECGKTFTKAFRLIEHVEGHHKEGFPCPKCGKKYACTDSLRVHMKAQHEQFKYQCEICNRKFLRKNAYSKHLNEHTGTSQSE